jgi:hypothetical protein
VKKLLLLAAVLLGTATVGWSQGNVVFNNFSPNTNYRIWTNNASGTSSNLMANTGTHYTIGLFVGPTNANWFELVGTVGNIGLSPGYFSGMNPFTLPAPYAAGTPINFQIRAWSATGGTSWEAALVASAANPINIALGTSAIGTVTPAGVGPAAPLFGTTPGLLTRGFEIGPVPEPSSIALGLLGLGCLALFRGRKRA